MYVDATGITFAHEELVCLVGHRIAVVLRLGLNRVGHVGRPPPALVGAAGKGSGPVVTQSWDDDGLANQAVVLVDDGTIALIGHEDRHGDHTPEEGFVDFDLIIVETVLARLEAIFSLAALAQIVKPGEVELDLLFAFEADLDVPARQDLNFPFAVLAGKEGILSSVVDLDGRDTFAGAGQASAVVARVLGRAGREGHTSKQNEPQAPSLMFHGLPPLSLVAGLTARLRKGHGL